MATADQKAKTGVYRYVVSIFEALKIDSSFQIKLFHSLELSAEYEILLKERPEWRELAFTADQAVSSHAVVFYPYFPYGARPALLGHLPQTQTLCDLYPLTHPEWFTAEAVRRFRRQLRGLIAVDHIFCISRTTEAELHRAFPNLRAQTSVSHLAADGVVPPKRPFPFFGNAIKRVLTAPYFVCVGTIEPRKNLRNVLAAFARLSRRAPELRMVVVGEQGWEVTTEELLQSVAGLDRRRVEFHGRVSDERLWELYSGAVCVAFPSLGEGFGLPILEAFKCGTPVVTSNCASMPEIATKGAVLVNPIDIDGISSAILRLTRDKDFRSQLAKEALQRAQDFSWRRCAGEHLRVFSALIDRGKQNIL